VIVDIFKRDYIPPYTETPDKRIVWEFEKLNISNRAYRLVDNMSCEGGYRALGGNTKDMEMYYNYDYKNLNFKAIKSIQTRGIIYTSPTTKQYLFKRYIIYMITNKDNNEYAFLPLEVMEGGIIRPFRTVAVTEYFKYFMSKHNSIFKNSIVSYSVNVFEKFMKNDNFKREIENIVNGIPLLTPVVINPDQRTRYLGLLPMTLNRKIDDLGGKLSGTEKMEYQTALNTYIQNISLFIDKEKSFLEEYVIPFGHIYTYVEYVTALTSNKIINYVPVTQYGPIDMYIEEIRSLLKTSEEKFRVKTENKNLVRLMVNVQSPIEFDESWNFINLKGDAKNQVMRNVNGVGLELNTSRISAYSRI
jgi:hypothetical protein